MTNDNNWISEPERIENNPVEKVKFESPTKEFQDIDFTMLDEAANQSSSNCCDLVLQTQTAEEKGDFLYFVQIAFKCRWS